MGKLMQKRKSGGGNRYRVLLLDHEKHTESRGELLTYFEVFMATLLLLCLNDNHVFIENEFKISLLEGRKFNIYRVELANSRFVSSWSL